MSSRDRDRHVYKVGELARLAGVSVRTLHHYEAIGLLVPSGRSDTGHRLYARAELERLVRITGLTALGLALDEVRAALDDPALSPRALIDRHLDRARELLAEQQALCERLEQLRQRLGDGDDDPDTLFETMEAMKMIEKYYTPEQLEQLAGRREELGDDAIRAVEREWQELFSRLRVLLDQGTPPDAPEVQAVARRARELIAMFTGGDPGIAGSLQRMHAEQPVDEIHPDFDPAIFAYLNQAMAADPADE
jgi:MerR family transcriptional regulator, thiopeptide resistance regulator